MNQITVGVVTIVTDKEITSISAGHVMFADGSTVDTSSGHVVNRGPGVITVTSPGRAASIGGTDAAEDATPHTRHEVRHDVQALTLSGLDADVHVRVDPAAGATVTLHAEGPQDRIDALRLLRHGDELTVTAGGAQAAKISGANVNISVGGRVGAVITGSQHIVSSPVGGRPATLKVTVGPGCDLRCDAVTGQVHVIGQLDASLTVVAQGSSSVRAAQVKALSVTAQGSADVHVEQVDGPASVVCQGSADVRVGAGHMPTLSVVCQGSADVRIGAHADVGSITASGSADVQVRSITRPQITSMGSADVRVG